VKDDSNCKRAILCDFTLSRDLYDARIEVCAGCSKKVIYPKINGELDERKYIRDHRRDTLQPFGRDRDLYRKIYGLKEVNAVIKKFHKAKSKEDIAKEWEETRKDSRDYIRKRVLGPATRGTDWS
jgi:hypothetical protein